MASVKITYIGHASFRFESERGTVIYYDPWLDENPIATMSREDVDHADIVMVSHGHNDHINAAAELAEAVEAPIWLHPDDGMLWDVVYPDRRVDDSLRDGASIAVGGEDLTIMHTPGHSPGGCCIHVPSLGLVFSGDTLFNGGPGATGRSFSSHDVLVGSIRSRLFVLPDETVVHTGHGDSTTIGREARNLDGLTDDVDRDPGSSDAAS